MGTGRPISASTGGMDDPRDRELDASAGQALAHPAGVECLVADESQELNGEDLRREPLEARKGRLAKALSRVKDGILLNEHIEDHGELGFEHACRLGLEGIIAKRLDMPYRSGRCKSWIK